MKFFIEYRTYLPVEVIFWQPPQNDSWQYAVLNNAFFRYKIGIDMDKNSKAYQITQKMLEHDAFSQWLGVELLDIGPGFCKLQMTIREEMLNGFYIAHGGITFSLADSAFAFASNSHGQQAVSIHTSIKHTKALKAGDTIIAAAEEEHKNHKIGVYTVKVSDQDGELVASFNGTVYRKSKHWEV
jgi:acyl-CoA thioesterase